MVLLSGQDAKDVLKSILHNKRQNTDKYPEPFEAGCFQEGDMWVGFDNTTGDCWVEEFKTRAETRCWITAK